MLTSCHLLKIIIKKECRIASGIAALVNDSASISVMIEGIGSRSRRWMKLKREEFIYVEEANRGTKKMPRCIERQESRLKHAISSLSSSSDSFNQTSSSSGDDSAAATRKDKRPHETSSMNTNNNMSQSHRQSLPKNVNVMGVGPSSNDLSATTQPDSSASEGAHKVSSSSGSGCGSGSDSGKKQDASNDYHNYHAKPNNDFHDYHAQPVPDPKLGYSDPTGSNPFEDSPEEESNSTSDSYTNKPSKSANEKLVISTDSSSGDDDGSDPCSPNKRRKQQHGDNDNTMHHYISATNSTNINSLSNSDPVLSKSAKIAKKGGISHNLLAPESLGNGASRMQHVAPAMVLPPFTGIGKRNSNSSVIASLKKGEGSSSGSSTEGRNTTPSQVGSNNQVSFSLKRRVQHDNAKDTGPAVIFADVETSSSDYGRPPAISAHYHINEDDMVLMDEVLMCPFVFRSEDAVACGALAECAMPGMLRAHFSSRNKLISLELTYDAMGFMQQLERASGNEGTAQIIPGSLEMALAPTRDEARVITLAESPYLIVNVNEVWTKITGYTQLEAEGREYMSLLEGDGTVSATKDRSGRPPHFLQDVAKGRPACSTNIHYDKDGRDFIEYVCSYPLTNANGEITQLLHVSKELPSSLQQYQDEGITMLSTLNPMMSMMQQQALPLPSQ